MRIGLIVCNALLVRFGIRPLKGVLPWIAGCGVVALGVLVFRAQQKLWRRDMLSKSQEVN
jgi:hypothetical protein